MTEKQKESIEILKEHYIKHNYYDDDTISVATIRVLDLIQKKDEEIEKKDKVIDLMVEDKYKNIDMLQMANIAKEVNYDQIKFINGIPDEEVLKIIKQYFEKKVEDKQC